MSQKNPGVIFDASNSWNGYNHQGKLAILFAIKKILELYDGSLSVNENKENLSSYFIEIEYLEDFSLGKVNAGKDEYDEIHQVKNHAGKDASNYNSALLGLAYHIQDMPTIKNAYLHTTSEINFRRDSVHEYIKKLVSSPTDLNNILNRINDLRNDESKKKDLYMKKGRLEDFVVRLQQALIEADNTQTRLDASNIIVALNALEKKTKERIHNIRTLSDEQIMKIKIFTYEINGTPQLYCKVNQIKQLVKNEISNSIDSLRLSPSWKTERFINSRYLYLSGKLDDHIIDRNLNYSLYKNNSRDRKIRLSQFYDWLTSNDIETADEEFYQYELKDIIFRFTDEYCEKCTRRKCDKCLVVSAINKIGQMQKKDMEVFLTLTCPSNNEKLSAKTFSEYLTKRRIQNPFLEGIRDISIPFEEDKQAITYIDSKTLQYILTTLENDDADGINTGICTDILRNKGLYELLMDYDCFISRNISVSSIQDEAQKLGKSSIKNTEMDERKKEHIAHLKDVSIVTLKDFENLIL